MRGSLFTSGALHVLVALAVWLFDLYGREPSDLPPVYQVSLVSAAELVAPQPTAPRPRPEAESVPEEEIPEPEAVEKIPDPDKEPAEEEPAPAREETPRPGPESGTTEGADLPVTLEGRPFEYPWYLEELVRKIERNWRPGTGAMKTTIYFRITSGGRITETRVETSSGSFLFDQAAQRAVRASDPMPPLPDGYSGDYLGVYFDFDSSVRPSG